MQQTQIQERWKRIANHLGLDIVTPFQVQLSNGETVNVELLLKNFGGENGMLIVSNFKAIKYCADELVDLGFGVTTANENVPSHVPVFDFDSIIEMLSDWGWRGPQENRPSWLG